MGKKISEVGGGIDAALTSATLFEIEKAGASGHTSLDEIKKFISPVVASENWADLPDPATLQSGNIVFCSDYPLYVGSYWKAVPVLGLYAPLAGEVLLGIIPYAITTEDGTAEQIVFQYPIGAGMAFAPVAMAFLHAFSKSSGAIAATMRIRLGPNGDVTDPVVQTVSLLAASRSPEVRSDIKFMANDACSSSPSLDNGVIDPTVVSSDVSISDVTAEDQFVTVTIEHASAGVTVTLKNGFMKLIVL